jgi:dephospho-CoA kinase
MRLIGLTGGIATGKTTVTRWLREAGAHVLDADELAREVVEPGTPGLRSVAERFPGVVGPDGRLDRAALAARVFGNEGERQALNAALHPLIQQAFLEKSQALADEGVDLIVYDAALLIENGLHTLMDGVILVTAPRPTQVERLVARNGMTPAQAEARIDAQLPLSQKLAHATWVIDNGGTLESTRAQVDTLWRQISEYAPRA